MTFQTIAITRAGFARLEAELNHLKYHVRPQISQAVMDAYDLGDLPENSEYDAARDNQSVCEAKISKLEHLYSHALVIDPVPRGIIEFGVTAVLGLGAGRKKAAWQVVSQYESDADSGRLSISSPL
ncbi:MAG: transcription elongation factor GreA, partial [Alphaproteobacteria bacterium]|nr:transcription elongation factor GreA [Alphaproteobacteria bacterium]